ncbi:hypothetical protein OG756_15365 [Streptomyces sp. NBC_01310]|uniref:hypothetical protein n=1 Tax=Streptomyces sp. NBC_01310 TaxID=2903820 RepID=UPI0035B577F1|nr:hypothetical protein OG756_15365 [Streptomyces sp. NBC_01310]
MENPSDQRTSWSEITTRVERRTAAKPALHDGGDWSTIESVTVTVVRSGSADTLPREETT